MDKIDKLWRLETKFTQLVCPKSDTLIRPLPKSYKLRNKHILLKFLRK